MFPPLTRHYTEIKRITISGSLYPAVKKELLRFFVSRNPPESDRDKPGVQVYSDTGSQVSCNLFSQTGETRSKRNRRLILIVNSRRSVEMTPFIYSVTHIHNLCL